MSESEASLHLPLQKVSVGRKLGKFPLHGDGAKIDFGEAGIDPLGDPETDSHTGQADQKQTGQKSENFGS